MLSEEFEYTDSPYMFLSKNVLKPKMFYDLKKDIKMIQPNEQVHHFDGKIDSLPDLELKLKACNSLPYVLLNCSTKISSSDNIALFANFTSFDHGYREQLVFLMHQKEIGQLSVVVRRIDISEDYVLCSNILNFDVAKSLDSQLFDFIICIDKQLMKLYIGFDKNNMKNNVCIDYSLQDYNSINPEKIHDTLSQNWSLVGFGLTDKMPVPDLTDISLFMFGSSPMDKVLIRKGEAGDYGFYCENNKDCVGDYIRPPLYHGLDINNTNFFWPRNSPFVGNRDCNSGLPGIVYLFFFLLIMVLIIYTVYTFIDKKGDEESVLYLGKE